MNTLQEDFATNEPGFVPGQLLQLTRPVSTELPLVLHGFFNASSAEQREQSLDQLRAAGGEVLWFVLKAVSRGLPIELEDPLTALLFEKGTDRDLSSWALSTELSAAARMLVASAIGSRAAARPDAGELARVLIELLQQADQLPLRLAAIDALGDSGIASEEAVEALRDFEKSSSTAEQTAAKEALAELLG